jgi:hypothetical protein
VARFRVKGFTDGLYGTALHDQAEILLRGLLGLLLSLGVARRGYTGFLLPRTRVPATYYYYKEEPQRAAAFVCARPLHASYQEVIENLEWSDRYAEVEVGDWPDTASTLQGILRLALEPSASRLLQAGHWYFESLCGGYSVAQFVHATVALESLLGEKNVSDLVGIGELLANRAAYMLAESLEHRDQLLREIKEAYNTRSRIVHEGHAVLDAGEKRQLEQLQRICCKVMLEEVSLRLDRDAAE